MTQHAHPAGRPTGSVAGLPDRGRCLVMGVVNVTPDSFSDGGRWLDPRDAIHHGLSLAAQGADLVDVGGESTRPGAHRPSLEEELRRVLPVVTELGAAGIAVSVDTMRAEVAEQAVEAGAVLINDVSGGQADPHMARIVAEAGVPWVLMHWRGHAARMQQRAVYDDVVGEVIGEWRQRADAALAAGVRPEQIVLDPGLGFAKTGAHNWALLAGMDRLAAEGYPVLIAASRKRFLGQLLAQAGSDSASESGSGPDAGGPRPPLGRDAATAAVTMAAALAGAWCVRVHEVAANLDAVMVAARLGAECG